MRPEESTTDPREVRWGSYWLSRLGILVLLTGLVYLANHVFQGAPGLMGALFKLIVLSAAGFGLFWLGTRLERKGQVNFGRILIAGGVGAVFYTTFAAHYVDALRVVPSAILDALLLLACAAWMVLLADRRQSQPMALLAVVLAYFTTVVTPYPSFAFAVSFVLALSAAWFLRRHGWSAIGFTVLSATYLRFIDWKIVGAGRWDLVHFLETGGNLWLFHSFFAACWLMFTAATLFSPHQVFTVRKRVLFLTLNNFLYWALVSLAIRAVDQTWVWKFTIGLGLLLVAVSRLAARRLPAMPGLARLWLAQGAILITLGLAIQFAKGEWSIIVALLSLAFLVGGHYSDSAVLRAAGYLGAVVAVVLAWAPAHETEGPGPWYAAAVGAVMIFSAWWVNHSRKYHPGFTWHSAFYSSLGLFVWFIVSEAHVSRIQLPLVLAIGAIALVASLYVLIVREIPVLAQFYLLAAHYIWLVDSEMVRGEGLQPMATFNKLGLYAGPGWVSFALLMITLGLSRWWETQRNKLLPDNAVRLLQGVYAFASIAILLFWLRPLTLDKPNGWMVVASVLAIATLLYGMLLHDWFLAAFGQIFTLQAVGAFCLLHAGAEPRGVVALVPVFTLLAIPHLVTALRRDAFAQTDWARLIHWMSGVYIAGAVLMLIAWVISDVSPANRFILLELLGFALLVYGALKDDSNILVCSLAFTTAAVFVCWRFHTGADGFLFRDLLAFTLLLLGQQASKFLIDRESRPPQVVQDMTIIIGIGSLWHWVNLWVHCHWGARWGLVRWPDSMLFDQLPQLSLASSPVVTVSWALLGLVVFGIGFVFKERMYRNLGLVILGAGVARAFLVDARQLGTFGRPLSFFILGGVLLLLGFAYGRFRNSFRQA